VKRYGARLLFMYSFSAGALKGQKEHKFLPFFRVYSFTFLSSPSSCFLILCFWIQIVYELGNEKIKESNDNDDDGVVGPWMGKWYKRRHTSKWKRHKERKKLLFLCECTSLSMNYVALHVKFFFLFCLRILCIWGSGYVYAHGYENYSTSK